MSKLNGSRPSDPLDELDDVIAELEGSEWDDEEITAEHYIRAEPGSNITVVTGKHAAMTKDQADEITLTDHGAPPKQSESPQSETPKSGVPGLLAAAGRFVATVLGAVKSWPTFGALAVLAALVAYWLRLRYGH